MIANTTNLTERELKIRKYAERTAERNRIKMENAKYACVNAYLPSANDTLSVADAACEKAVGNLGYINKDRFCLDRPKEIEALLRSADITEETLEHAIGVLKRLCDAHAMRKVLFTCVPRRRGLDGMDVHRRSERANNFLNEMEMADAKRCKKAMNSLDNENKQKFCLNNQRENSPQLVKKVCDAFTVYINAVTNYQCIAPYMDTLWYAATEEELREIGSNCIKAIDELYDKNKENYCKGYEKTLSDLGSLLPREVSFHGPIKDRAINVVKGYCSRFFPSRERREINKAMEAIKMENAANGISEGLNTLTSESATALIPKNSFVGHINATSNLQSASIKAMGAIGEQNSGMAVVAIGAIGALATVVNVCAFWTMMKYWKKSDSNVENLLTEKQGLLNNHY